ncbi:hypothetical protein [Mangrovicoccus sp. HB161399]|uniref:hypothetical protein n=1 Tax=Mangrovicoccus sp. HB161399 TaxID=2720392 RepID=UPI00155265CE|nr:hypothetical protein [Mangrovicoccus sp. HB161399]
MTAPLPGPGAFRQPRRVLEHLPSPWNHPLPAGPLQGRFAPGTALYHGGGAAAPVLEALGTGLALRAGEAAPGYVSLALDLPGEMAADLGPAHDLRVRLDLAALDGPMPGAAHLRLSIRDAGDPWQVTVPISAAPGPQEIALGPGPSAPPPLRGLPRRAWVDLVFSGLSRGSAAAIPALAIRRTPAPVL